MVNNLKISTSSNDTFIGGLGNDALTGNGGADIFDYNAIIDGNDAITDFVIGNGSNGDKLNLKDLLSYQAGDTLSNFLSVTDASSGGDVVINIDNSGTDLSITLSGIVTCSLTLSNLINKAIVCHPSIESNLKLERQWGSFTDKDDKLKIAFLLNLTVVLVQVCLIFHKLDKLRVF